MEENKKNKKFYITCYVIIGLFVLMLFVNIGMISYDIIRILTH